MDAKNYWDNRYANSGTSGYGSYGEQLGKKLEWLKGLDINTITEIGCGDFNFGNHLLKLYPQVRYLGIDISEVVIASNILKHPQHQFIANPFFIPPGDLLMCIDVLFHILDDREYEQMLTTLHNTWTKYLAVTAYERYGDSHETGNHVQIRKFDYRSFGKPLIREVVEEDGQLYFYLFKR